MAAAQKAGDECGSSPGEEVSYLPSRSVLSEVVARASVVPHSTFYLDFLSWSCEQAEMQLKKQAGSLKLILAANSKIERGLCIEKLRVALSFTIRHQ
jgi:hypothetical protein